MYLPNEQSKVFCLECVSAVNDTAESAVFPLLEQLVQNHHIVNVYKAVDSIDDFENSLNVLLYEDRNFKDYDLLYFICGGTENEIIVNDYLYTLEEIAELFEGKLKGKILHFANSKTLNLDSETAQYFLDVTGAKAISGYQHQNFTSSILLDYHFLALHIHFTDVTELVEELFQKHYALCTNLGFHLYY
ncbi:DUF6642 family protein [Paenimyroides aestuarii]|uniref:Uncharacterized protein n=1 Tax=Paenimyroides aestuarii TaxID=2968490 RepID=A0ABY5NTH1_9FLAO|nr:DUF6642 family protein [Paenimyroides aestuarii]UUV21828.1 hypothetical protein NPX36_01885 [Paenimyroides aestuarii]